MSEFGVPTLMNDLKNLRFSTMTNFFRTLPYILKTSPGDVKAAYYSMLTGILLVLVQMVVSLLL